MASTKINLAGVGAPVSEGDHDARFTSYKKGMTSGSNGKEPAEKVDLTFTIDGGPDDGRKMTRTYVLSKKALWALKGTLIVLGSDPDDLEGEIDLDEELPRHNGNSVVLSVVQKEYTPPNGERPRTVANIETVKDASAGALFK